jgi:hypothetical protein
MSSAPNRPVATAVALRATQKRDVSRTASWTLFGCSIAPRPLGRRRAIKGAGSRDRSVTT